MFLLKKGFLMKAFLLRVFFTVQSGRIK